MNNLCNDAGLSGRAFGGIERGFLAAMTVVALVLAIEPSLSAASQRSGGGPQLVLDKARHDFGEVFAGEDLSHVFLVRNIGSVPLELSEMPQPGTRPSKVSFRQPLSGMRTGPFAKMRSAAPS